MTRQEHTQIFADRLNILKNDRDLTYRELERLTGISHSMLGKYTLGKEIPNGYTAARIAEFFGVTMDWLFGLSDDMGRQT